MLNIITVNTNKNIIFFDTSYCIFYKYYSVLNWYKLHVKDTTQMNVLQNECFKNKYAQMFEKSIIDIIKVYNIDFEDVYLIKDAPRDEIWRNKLFNGYKADRENKRDTFDKNIFGYTYNEVIPNLQKKYNGIQLLGVPKMEADDIIGVIKNTVRKNNPDIKIYIVTNDNDYIQLYDTNTLIFNLKKQHLCDRINVNVNDYILYKTIVGDKSDNIPAISKKIGVKTAEKMMRDKTLLDNIFNKNPDSKKQYELNASLINMGNIPNELQDQILKYVTFI